MCVKYYLDKCFFSHFYCSWSVGFGFAAERKAASNRNSVQICLYGSIEIADTDTWRNNKQTN